MAPAKQQGLPDSKECHHMWVAQLLQAQRFLNKGALGIQVPAKVNLLWGGVGWRPGVVGGSTTEEVANWMQGNGPAG